MRILIYIEEARHLRLAREIVDAMSPGDQAAIGGPGLCTGNLWDWKSSEELDHARPPASHVNRQPKWRRLWNALLRVHFARSMIREIDPDIVVMLEENAGGLTSFIAQAAKDLRRPTVIVADYIPNPEEPAKFHFHDKMHQRRGPLGHLLSWLFPAWVLSYHDRNLFRLPSTRMMFYYWIGWRPLRPWILNSGYAAAIAIDSEASRERYLKLGFDNRKLRVIGGSMSDRLHEATLSRKARRKAVEDNRPLLVCALPPNQYGLSDISAAHGFEFPNYDALLGAWLGLLTRASEFAKVLVFVHPRETQSEYMPVVGPSVLFSTEPLDQFLPIADLFLASASTTIGWSLSVGVPVVNYDCYRYRYNDFADALGVEHIFDRQACETILLGLLENPSALAARKTVATADAGRWGIVDGHFKQRLGDLLREVASSDWHPSPTHPQPNLLGSI